MTHFQLWFGAGDRFVVVAGSQLEQIREAAERLERYGADFLAGDFSRFLELAKPLPPYKRCDRAATR